MPRGYSKNKPSIGTLPPGNNTDLMARAEQGHRRYRKRHAHDEPQETSYDRDFIALRCPYCDEIFNGPYRGKKVKAHSVQYRRINEAIRRKGEAAGVPNEHGGISDAVCNKRSCIEKGVEEHFDFVKSVRPERDYSADKRQYLETEYEERRQNTDRYPGGLIDDVEPPL